MLDFCESPCHSREGAIFLWVPLPLTLGCFIFVSPLASHVGVLYFCESPCLSRRGALFIYFLMGWKCSEKTKIFVYPKNLRKIWKFISLNVISRKLFLLYLLFVSDKNPALNEFVSQIKSTAELQPLFDMIQKDCSGSSMNEANIMDQS